MRHPAHAHSVTKDFCAWQLFSFVVIIAYLLTIASTPITKELNYFAMYSDISDMNGESCDSNKQKKLEMEKKGVKRFYAEKNHLSDNESEGDSEEEAAAGRKRRKSAPIKKYNSTFLSLGFMENLDHKTPRPQCLICGNIFPNNFMKSSKLRRHFRMQHSELIDKPTTYFASNLEALNMKKSIHEK